MAWASIVLCETSHAMCHFPKHSIFVSWPQQKRAVPLWCLTHSQMFCCWPTFPRKDNWSKTGSVKCTPVYSFAYSRSNHSVGPGAKLWRGPPALAAFFSLQGQISCTSTLVAFFPFFLFPLYFVLSCSECLCLTGTSLFFDWSVLSQMYKINYS